MRHLSHRVCLSGECFWFFCLHQDEEDDSGSWLVYVKPARCPIVKGLTVLPKIITGWFSHFRFRPEEKFDFASVVRCLLEDSRRSTLLSEFVSFLSRCQTMVKFSCGSRVMPRVYFG